MRAGWGRAVLLAGVLAMSACGSDDTDGDPAASEPEASAPPLSAYASAVNDRCEKFADAVLGVTGGGEPAVAKFNADQPKLKQLTDAFDAGIATIPATTDEDRKAAATFKAFQRFSDAAYAKVLAVAKTGDQAKFDTAFEAFLAEFDNSTVPADLAAVGINCPAR
jgi:hypothetical protein